jgi:predicted metal-binding membrane protein
VIAQSSSVRLRRQRNLVLASLLVLAALCWLVVVRQATGTMPAAGFTMGLTLPVFMVAWVAMMIAMMFPTAAPMIVMFATVSAGKRQRAEPFVPTWIFVAAYLVIWVGFGVVAYAAAAGIGALAMGSAWVMDNAARLGGAVLVAGGLYQLTPLKNVCLAKCRSPLSFLLTSWRDGYGGAFVTGLRHGAYCLGCCWLLFAILFPLGVMNVAAMVGLTVLIFAEKSLPQGAAIARVAGVALIVYGAVVLVSGRGLPGMTM